MRIKTVVSSIAFTAIMAMSSLAFSGPASATVLFDETNITPMGTVSESFEFTATALTTTLSDEGYQLPGFDQFTDNSVTLTVGGPNLLEQTWNFTPATSGSDTQQYNDGTLVDALSFGAVTVGDYDTYYQTFATVPGQSYTYSFNFVDNDGPQDGYIVETDSGISAAPEPSIWSLMIAGVGVLGAALRLSRRREGMTFLAA